MTQPLAPDYLEYLALRGSTDCLLAYQVGRFYEFHGQDALALASVFVLPVGYRWTDAGGEPVPMCAVGIKAKSTLDGDQATVAVSFDPDLTAALNEAGYPVALAHEWPAEDGGMYRKIDLEYRPRLDRPPLGVVN
jgi:MutS domain I